MRAIRSPRRPLHLRSSNSPSSAFTMARSHRSSMILQQPATRSNSVGRSVAFPMAGASPTSQSPTDWGGLRRGAADGDDPPAPIPSADGPQLHCSCRRGPPKTCCSPGNCTQLKRTIQHSAWRWRSPREAPLRASDFDRRIDGLMVKETIPRLGRNPSQVFVCGSNGFVNIATDGAPRQASTLNHQD